jgi:hypothetical protein
MGLLTRYSADWIRAEEDVTAFETWQLRHLSRIPNSQICFKTFLTLQSYLFLFRNPSKPKFV